METVLFCIVVFLLCPLAVLGIGLCKKGFPKSGAAYFNYVTAPTYGLVILAPFYLLTAYLREDLTLSTLFGNLPHLALLSGWVAALLLLKFVVFKK